MLPVIEGDIWTVRNQNQEAVVVIPTNIGWKKNGENVMGRGVAEQAKLRYPQLPALYGEYCKTYKQTLATVYFPDYKLICLPTKKLNEESPHLSWQNKASLKLIERNLKNMNEFCIREKLSGVLVPVLGAGNGQLNEEDVLPLIHELLDPSHFFLVKRGTAK